MRGNSFVGFGVGLVVVVVFIVLMKLVLVIILNIFDVQGSQVVSWDYLYLRFGLFFELNIESG